MAYLLWYAGDWIRTLSSKNYKYANNSYDKGVLKELGEIIGTQKIIKKSGVIKSGVITHPLAQRVKFFLPKKIFGRGQGD